MRSIRLVLPAALGAVLLSCGESIAPIEPAATLLVVSGDLQLGTVGDPLPAPLVVRVLGASGKPVKGQVVNFRVTAGGGDVYAGVGITDGGGYASEIWTLGTVAGDHHRVEARAVDPRTGTPLVFGTFRATALPGPVATVDVTPDSVQLASVGETAQLTAAAFDQYGNAITDAEFTWSSGDNAVATVDQTGLVTAAAPGVTTVSVGIGATVGDLGTAQVTVLAPDPSLLLWYRLDGDALDASARQKHGQLLGAVLPVEDRHGRNGRALQFPGVIGSTMMLPIEAINDVPIGTIAVWVRLNEISSGAIVVKQHNDINTYAHLSVGYVSNQGGNYQLGTPGQIYYHGRNSGGQLASNSILEAGRWYHLAVVFGANGAQLYIDGQFDTSAAGDFSIPFDTDERQWRWPGCCSIHARIGSWDYYGQWLSGALDDFRLYGRALSAGEIATLSSAAAP